MNERPFEIIVRNKDGMIIYLDYIDCVHYDGAAHVARETCRIVKGETWEVNRL